jgi:hypothetical protein
MDIHHLIQQRDAILRQARLTNLAYAHRRLGEFSARFARAGITGAIRVEPAAPAEGRPEATIDADRAPAVLAEHFLEEDAAELADLLGFVRGQADDGAHTLDIGEIETALRPALARALAREGVTGFEAPPDAGRRRRDS